MKKLMGSDNLYDQIREMLGSTPVDFSILEEKVDINLQMEYFELSKTLKESLIPEEVIQNKDDIFSLEVPEKNRMKRFAELASIEDVIAYRTLEKYVGLKLPELKDWAILALQESRMLLESRLLEENRVFISTGLGGRETGLRYFVVLFINEGKKFSVLNRKIIRNELQVTFKKFQADLEKLTFSGAYASLLVIIPIHVPVMTVFREIIKECNLYGNFLKTDYVITNVKVLSKSEIDDFLKKKGKKLL